ncbi:hypothetical protein ACF06Q_31195 [Streptomyces leeuwenhoekii]|uniref:hypothetical protein n=1 Tax=Streptomyces leeuwenhoekii TaxID=1437453 RepID=UPI0036F8C032
MTYRWSPTSRELEAARRLIARHLSPTPVDLGAGTAREPVLKLECLQPTGSFLRYLAAHRGYVAEGSGAVPVAALLAGKVPAHGRMVAVVSGRNIGLSTLAAVLAPPPKASVAVREAPRPPSAGPGPS